MDDGLAVGSPLAPGSRVSTAVHSSGRVVVAKQFDLPARLRGAAAARAFPGRLLDVPPSPHLVSVVNTRLQPSADDAASVTVFMDCMPGLRELFSAEGGAQSLVGWSEAQGAAAVRDVLRGLEELHCSGVAYGGTLRPSDVVVNPEGGAVMLTGFGAASVRLADAESGNGGRRTFSDTALAPPEGAVAGEVRVGPDGCSVDAAAAAADVWSVGCVTQLMLTGTLPQPQRAQPGTTTTTTRRTPRTAADELVDGGDSGSGNGDGDLPLSLQASAFLQACLAAAPADRPSASALLRHPWIRTASSSVGGGASAGGGGGGVTAAATAAAFYMLLPGAPPPSQHEQQLPPSARANLTVSGEPRVAAAKRLAALLSEKQQQPVDSTEGGGADPSSSSSRQLSAMHAAREVGASTPVVIVECPTPAVSQSSDATEEVAADGGGEIESRDGGPERLDTVVEAQQAQNGGGTAERGAVVDATSHDVDATSSPRLADNSGGDRLADNSGGGASPPPTPVSATAAMATAVKPSAVAGSAYATRSTRKVSPGVGDGVALAPPPRRGWCCA